MCNYGCGGTTCRAEGIIPGVAHKYHKDNIEAVTKEAIEESGLAYKRLKGKWKKNVNARKGESGEGKEIRVQVET